MSEILIISVDFPYPVDTGKKVVLNGILQYFMDKVGCDNITWVLIGVGIDDVYKLSNPNGIKVKGILLPHIASRICYLIWYSLICRSKSLQESLFYSPSIQRQINDHIELLNPDIVVFDTIRMGQFNPSQHKQKAILYLEDLFSVRYRRMLEQLQQGRSFGTTVLGNFARFIPAVLCSQINKSRSIQSLLLNFEQCLVARSEHDQPKHFNTSLLVNAEEVEELRKRSPGTNIQFMPPFLKMPNNLMRNYDGKGTFIYLGALKYPPNEAGLLEFLSYGLEPAIKNIPDFEFVIVGKGASQRLIDAVGIWKGRVRLAGFVDDLSIVFSSCCAMLLPIVLGTGVKLKALEAMSHGVPVISTRMGIDSIPVSHGKDCFIEDDLSKFWVWMKILTEEKCNQKMSDAASKSFKCNYSKEVVYDSYDRIFDI